MNTSAKPERSEKLPIQIIDNILTRLPVKPLLRFKTVSKSWRSMISSRQFAKSHVKTSSTTTNLDRFRFVKRSGDNRLQFKSLSSLLKASHSESSPYYTLDKFHPHVIHIMSSFHGLLCLITETLKVILWNPSMRTLRALRPLPRIPFNAYSLCGCGFGYDESHDDYKVLIVNSTTTAWVYSLRSDSWKAVSGCNSAVPLPRGRASACANSKLYWNPQSTMDDNWTIEFFDLEKEVFGEIKNPCGEKVLSSDLYLRGFGDSICLYRKYFMLPQVWVLKGDQCNWEEVSKISLMTNFEESVRFCCETMNEFVFSKGSELVVYNFLDVLFKRPDLSWSWFDPWRIVDVYTESLVSLDFEYERQNIMGDDSSLDLVQLDG